MAAMAWRTWRTLGAPAHAEPLRMTMVDPEALIAITATLAEPRVVDVATQWCRDNQSMISIQRLRAVAAAGGPGLHAAVARFVARVNDVEFADEASLRFTTKPALDAEPAVRIRVEDPAMLRLRIRSLLGPTARAEVLAILLARSEPGGTTTSTLSRLSLFGQRYLREALNELVYGGWVTRWRTGPREYRYEATPSSRNAFGSTSLFVDWVARAIALDALLRASRELANPSVGTIASSMGILDGVSTQLRDLSVPLPDWLDADTEAGLSRVTSWLDESVQLLVAAS